MKFLGHIITTKGIKIDPEKVEIIEQFERPSTPKEVRSFLGLINFSSKFTNRIAFLTGPLLELTKKGVKWRWGEGEQRAFEEVKQLFCKEAFLDYPSPKQPYILHTDASFVGLGAALCQEDPEGNLRIINLASRRLRGPEINYFASEIELLAIVWALSKFRSYLLGAEVLVRSDHKALAFLNTCRFVNGRLMRWALGIQDYRIRMSYLPGKSNALTDTLAGYRDINEKRRESKSITYSCPEHQTLSSSKNQGGFKQRKSKSQKPK